MIQSNDLHQEREFVGSLGIKDKQIPITFKARMDETGELRLHLEEIPLSDDTNFILLAWGDSNTDLARFRLSGRSKDAVELETDRLLFNSIGPHSSTARGPYYVFDGHAVEATFRRPSLAAHDRPILTLWLRGFRCFGQITARSELGTLTAQGDYQGKDAKRLDGHVSIHADAAPDDIQKWRQDALRLLNHMRRVMSFAAGVKLSDPALEFRFGNDIEINIQSRNIQHHPGWPVIHMMDRQPIFDAAARSYFNPPYAVENLWMALEWIVMPATFNEARVVNAMTALENLVSANTRDVAYLLDEKPFDNLRKALKKTIDGFLRDNQLDSDGSNLGDELCGKLQELRRRSLRRKLDVLLERWSVPTDDIGKKKIRSALEARNNIVHEGRYYVDGTSQVSLYEHIGVVRELVSRVVFRAIGFEGRYVSHLGGYHQAIFPPPNA